MILDDSTNFFSIYFRKFYYPADAYNKSKLAQVLFTKHLQVLLSQSGLKIQTNSLHPGVVDTDLFANSSTDYIPWFRTLLFKVSYLRKNGNFLEI
jgi:NAD(P)-dependent dehydrogenase (short-subunit alcohol dehydrogenase family)